MNDELICIEIAGERVCMWIPADSPFTRDYFLAVLNVLIEDGEVATA